MFDAETIREALKQGAGFFVALIMFAVWLQEKKNDTRRADEVQKRLEGILHDRKADRDKMIATLARIDLRLEIADRADAA